MSIFADISKSFYELIEPALRQYFIIPRMEDFQ